MSRYRRWRFGGIICSVMGLLGLALTNTHAATGPVPAPELRVCALTIAPGGNVAPRIGYTMLRGSITCSQPVVIFAPASHWA